MSNADFLKHLKEAHAEEQKDLDKYMEMAKNAEISNYNQSQYLLGQMGKWVANAAATA